MWFRSLIRLKKCFPYSGRVEFSDPETGSKFTVGNAEGLKGAYEQEITVRTSAMREATNGLGMEFHKASHGSPGFRSSSPAPYTFGQKGVAECLDFR